MPIPKEKAHTLPIIHDSGNLLIIFNNQNGLVEPYTSTTVQRLFKTQACISMTATYEANEWACPDNPSQLWHQSNPVHHVVDDPNTIPLDLATRLIQVITTRRGSDSVYCAWALPAHLESALHHTTDQMTHNRFHFSGNNTITQNTHTPTRQQTFSLISTLVSLVLSVPQNEMSTQSITGISLTPPCNSQNDVQ
jgi:hypothetical protein